MRVNGYQCDACCTVKSGENSLKDWFAVYDFRKGVESDEQHFCSTHCLHEWVEKQIPVVEEVRSDSDLHYKLTVNRDVVAVEDHLEDLK